MAEKKDKKLIDMPNLTVTQKANGMISIEYDPKVELGKSESKRSRVITTSKGNLKVLDHIVSFHAYKPA